jgi:exopolyphosphatase / guanosine-5'-triphosphate,3'-diphosphate pyrophosphatase
VKDPERGASAPERGASGAARSDSSGRFAPSDQAQAGRRKASPPKGRRGSVDAPDQPPAPKKRRKRRRGRKVYARDTSKQAQPASAPGAGQPEAAQAGVQSPVVDPQRSADAAPAAAQPINGSAIAPGLPLRSRERPVYAALDLGTNNCRLLVAVPGRPGQFRVIDAFSRIVRLGEGLSASGRLNDKAMDRAVEALKVCADKLGSRNVKRARLIATEACRSAENGPDFIDRVHREAGLKLEIIDRRTEARLAVSGCASLIERDTDGVVLFDIGGGSSEIALIDLSRHRTPRLANHIVSWTSLPVGVVSLAERFGGRDVTRDIFSAMVDYVSQMLTDFEGREKLSHLVAGKRFHLLGTSGTVTTLAGVHLGLERYDRRRVDGLWMQDGMVDAMIDRLLGWGFEERVANPCIGADRADLVLAGCAILEAIRRCWPSPRLRVADRGLREGILSELMADDGIWRKGRRRGYPG